MKRNLGKLVAALFLAVCLAITVVPLAVAGATDSQPKTRLAIKMQSKAQITNAEGKTLIYEGLSFRGRGDMEVFNVLPELSMNPSIFYQVPASETFTYAHISGDEAEFWVIPGQDAFDNYAYVNANKNAKTITATANDCHTIAVTGKGVVFTAGYYAHNVEASVRIAGSTDSAFTMKDTSRGIVATGLTGAFTVDTDDFKDTKDSQKTATFLATANEILITNITAQKTSLSASGTVKIDGAYYKKLGGIRVKSVNNPNALAVCWRRVTNADGYVLYRYNTKTKKYQAIKTLTGNDANGYVDTGLDPQHTYSYKVRSFRTVKGKRVYSSYTYAVKAVTAHALNPDGTTPATIKANATKITVSKKETKSKAKTKKVRVYAQVSAPAGTKLISSKVRWYSTNKKVAQVSATGKVTKKKKGTCYIYAVTHNGLISKRIKVVVKSGKR